MARILGIDVGTTALRGVLLRSSMRRVEEERYVEIPLTQPLGAPGRLPELTEAVQNLVASLPGPPDSVVAAVAGEHTSLRNLELPAAARKRIAEVLPFELEAALPFEPEDAVIDHQVIDVEGDVLKLLATAVPRKHVEHALAEFAKIGVAPHELAAGAAALDGLSNLLPELAGEEPILLIDWADERIDLCFMRKGRCVLARTLAVGLSQMPQASNEVRQGVLRTMAAFRAAGNPAPSRVYLSGSGGVADGAARWLSSAIDHDVQLIALPVNKEVPGGGAAFGKAAALAARTVSTTRRINLRVGEFAPADTGGGLMQHVNLLVTCAVIVVMTIMFSLKARQSLLVDENAALQAQLESATKEVFGKSIGDAQEAEMQVNNLRSDDPLPRFDAFDALAAVSAAVPPEISHEVRRMTIDVADEKREGTMELQGSVASIAQRDQLASELEKHPCFKDIDLGKTSPGRGQDVIQYTIEAVVQCPGDAPPGKKKGESSK